MEQLQPRRPATRATGQGGCGLRGQRSVVDRAEELLDLPGAEPQVLAVDHDQLTGHQQPGRVQARLATAAQRDRDRPRTQPEEGLQRGLGGRTGDLVEVVDDQPDRADVGSIESSHEVGDPTRGRRLDDAGIGQRRTEGEAEVPGQRDLFGVLGSGPVPGRGQPVALHQLGEQRRLARTRRSEHQQARAVLAQVRQSGQPSVEPLPDQSAQHRTADLLQEDHRIQGAAQIVHRLSIGRLTGHDAKRTEKLPRYPKRPAGDPTSPC